VTIPAIGRCRLHEARLGPAIFEFWLIVHVSYTFGRVLVKFIGTHSEYDRIDPETVSWRKD
jgi:RelE-like HigB toxin of type II HigAB toxin-antitoxin system